MFDALRRLETGLVCLLAAVGCWAGYASARLWAPPASLMPDWLASCALALAFAAIAFGAMRFAQRRGKLAVFGGLAVVAALVLVRV